MNTSPPTVVRVLAALEAELGFSLFIRTTRKVTPTPEAEVYLSRCDALLTDLEHTEAELSGTAQNPRGAVTISAPNLFGQRHVTPALLALCTELPEISPRLMLADRIVGLVEEGVDIAIRIGTLDDSTLRARRAGDVRQVLCASPELIARIGRPSTPRDLEGLPCIAVDGNSGGRTWPFLGANGTPKTAAIEPVFTCNVVPPAIDACLAGVGFSLFLDYQVAADMAAGRLVSLLEQSQPAPLPVHVVRRNDPHPPTRVLRVFNRLFDLLRGSLRSNAPGALPAADG